MPETYNDIVARYLQAHADLAKEEEKKQKKGIWDDGYQFGDVLKTVGGTIGDVAGNVVSGATKAVEGLVDTVQSVVGTVGSWMGNKSLEEQMKNNVAFDWTEKYVTRPRQQFLSDLLGNASLLDNTGDVGRFLDDVTTNIGFMLPAIAVNAIPGVGQAASLATFAGSAMGSSTESAVNQGHELPISTGYGFASGITEALIESISGGLGGVTGKSALKTGAKAMAKDVVGEGFEEVASGMIDPFLRKITIEQDSDPLAELGNYFKSGDWAKDFAGGAVSSGILKGADVMISNTKYGNEGRKARNNLVELQEINRQGVETANELLRKRSDYARASESQKAKIKADIDKLESKRAQLRSQATEYINEHNSLVDKISSKTKQSRYNEKYRSTAEVNSALASDQKGYEKQAVRNLADGHQAIDSVDFNDNMSADIFGRQRDGNITLNTKTLDDNSVAKTMAHEALHAVNDQIRSNLVKGVIKDYQSKGIYESAFADYQNAYGDKGVDYINEEIAADYIGDILSDYRKLELFMKKDSSLAWRVKHALKKVLKIDGTSDMYLQNRLLKELDKGLKMKKSEGPVHYSKGVLVADSNYSVDEVVDALIENSDKIATEIRYDDVGPYVIFNNIKLFSVYPASIARKILVLYLNKKYRDTKLSIDGDSMGVIGKSVKEMKGNLNTSNSYAYEELEKIAKVAKLSNTHNQEFERNSKNIQSNAPQIRFYTARMAVDDVIHTYGITTRYTKENGLYLYHIGDITNKKASPIGSPTKGDALIIPDKQDPISYTFGETSTNNMQNSDENVKNPVEVKERRKVTVNPTFITSAPFYNTQITKDNYKEIRDRVDKPYRDTAVRFAEALGIDIMSVNDNIGGFEFQEGIDVGKRVNELSYTFEVKGDRDTVDLFACLMGDLAYEQQEAVISANYLDSDNADVNAFEFSIGFRNLEGVQEALLKSGIKDYTIDVTNKVIKILEFDIANPHNTIQKTVELTENLGGNYDGRTKEKEIASRYLDKDARRRTYKTWLASNNTGLQPSGPVVYLHSRKRFELIQEALARLGDGGVKERRKIQKRSDYSDDFRRIQEESRRLHSTISQQERVKSFDDSLRNRVTGILSREIRDFNSRNSYSPRLLDNTVNFKIFNGIDGNLFHDVFEISRTYLKNGELVDLHDNYNDSTCYLSEDGLSGFAITNKGDLVSVFNLSKEKGFLRAIAPIIKANAKTLDCYVSPYQNLQGMYEAKFGFKTASLMDYNMEYDHDDIAKNHSKPKVAFMVNTEKIVEQKTFNENQYDEAVEYQRSFIENVVKERRSVSDTNRLNALRERYNGKVHDGKVYSKPSVGDLMASEDYASASKIVSVDTTDTNFIVKTEDGKTYTMNKGTERATQKTNTHKQNIYKINGKNLAEIRANLDQNANFEMADSNVLNAVKESFGRKLAQMKTAFGTVYDLNNPKLHDVKSTIESSLEISREIVREVFKGDNTDKIERVLKDNDAVFEDGKYVLTMNFDAIAKFANLEKLTNKDYVKMMNKLVFDSVELNGVKLSEFMQQDLKAYLLTEIGEAVEGVKAGMTLPNLLASKNVRLLEKLKETRKQTADTLRIYQYAQKLKKYADSAITDGVLQDVAPLLKTLAKIGTSSRVVKGLDTDGKNVRQIIGDVFDKTLSTDEKIEAFAQAHAISVSDEVYYSFNILQANRTSTEILTPAETEALKVIARFGIELAQDSSRVKKAKAKVTRYNTVNAAIAEKSFFKSDSAVLNRIKDLGLRYGNKRMYAKVLGLTEIFDQMDKGQADAIKFQLKYRDAVRESITSKEVSKMLKGKTKFLGVDIPNDNLIMLYLTSLDAKGYECLTQRPWYIVDTKGKKTRMEQLSTEGLDNLREIIEGNDNMKRVVDAYRTVAAMSWDDTNQVYEELYGIRDEDSDSSTYAELHAADGAFRRNMFDNPRNVGSLNVTGAGFIKQRTNKPISLNIYGVLYNIDNMIVQRANYNGMKAISDEVNRLFNVRGDYGMTLNERYRFVDNSFTKNRNQLGVRNFFAACFNEIQGVKRQSDSLESTLAKFRSNYSVFALGLNPKVTVQQVVSYALAFTKLPYKYFAKGLKGFGSRKATAELMQHSAYMRNRYENGGLVEGLANVVYDVADVKNNWSKMKSFFTKSLSFMDKRTLTAIYEASKAQFKEQGLTGDELLKAAAKQTEEICRQTQPATSSFDKPIAISQGSELTKTMNMFTSQTYQIFSMAIEPIIEHHMWTTIAKNSDLQQRIGVTKDDLQQKLNGSKKLFAKTSAAMLTQGVMLSLLALAFKHLYGQADKDDETLQEFAVELANNTLFGMIPYVRDVYSMMTSGFDIEPASISVINDAIGAFRTLINSVGDVAAGKNISFAQLAWDVASGLGPISGVPFRNIYKVVFGAVKTFDPALAIEVRNATYGVSSATYGANYKDLVESGKFSTAEKVLQSYFEKYKGERISSKSAKVITNLYAEGKTGVIPKSIPTSVNRNGVDVELKRVEIDAFSRAYSVAGQNLDRLLNNATFNALSTEDKAGAIKAFYDTYYDLAMHAVFKDHELSKTAVFANAVGTTTFIKLLAYARHCKSIVGDEKSKRSEKVFDFIDGLPLNPNEKTIVLLMAGYKGSEAKLSALNSAIWI